MLNLGEALSYLSQKGAILTFVRIGPRLLIWKASRFFYLV